MRHLLFIPLFFFITSISFANNNSLSYNDYISQYGKDATSVAIIDVFFESQGTKGNNETSYIPTSNGEYSNKNLMKALKNYQTKNRMESSLVKKVNKKMEAESGITNEGYSNLMNATLKKMAQE